MSDRSINEGKPSRFAASLLYGAVMFVIAACGRGEHQKKVPESVDQMKARWDLKEIKEQFDEIPPAQRERFVLLYNQEIRPSLDTLIDAMKAEDEWASERGGNVVIRKNIDIFYENKKLSREKSHK